MTTVTAREANTPGSGPVDPQMIRRLAGLVASAPSRPVQASHAPFDGTVIGEVPICRADDVAEAAARARRAQQEWALQPLRTRRSVLLRFHDLVLSRREQLLDLVQAETGKARADAFEEVADAAVTARYYANSAERHLKKRRRQGALPLLTTTFEVHRPKGLVGVISPWNYPFTLAVSDAVPALLAGNAVLLKPDSQTPFSALAALELLAEAGLPRDLFQVVTGDGPELGGPMIEHADFLMFTGSTGTGRILAEQCARRLTGFSAELGGKNPLLVLADADLEKAAQGAVAACFSNTGQLCISMERLYIEEAVYDDFVEAFLRRVEAIRIGPGYTWEAEMGSLTGSRQLDTVTRHVQDAVSKGARVLAGGRHRPDLGPFFYEPTVLAGVTDSMVVAQEETFGPVATLYRVRNEDEAVALANSGRYGLNASVWSTPEHGTRVASRIEAGTVNVNDGYAAAWASHDAPMGGMGDSGMGRRHGRDGILKYTEAQTIAVQRLMPVGPAAGMPLDRYAEGAAKALQILRRLPFIR